MRGQGGIGRGGTTQPAQVPCWGPSAASPVMVMHAVPCCGSQAWPAFKVRPWAAAEVGTHSVRTTEGADKGCSETPLTGPSARSPGLAQRGSFHAFYNPVFRAGAVPPTPHPPGRRTASCMAGSPPARRRCCWRRWAGYRPQAQEWRCSWRRLRPWPRPETNMQAQAVQEAWINIRKLCTWRAV